MDIQNANLNREELIYLINNWMDAWNNHDFDKVMALFAPDAEFIAWTGTKVSGIDALSKAWKPWFDNHQNFQFKIEQMVIDEVKQSVVITWTLDWLSHEVGYQGEKETRKGIDFLKFEHGLLIKKHTYSQTVLKISGQLKPLLPR